MTKSKRENRHRIVFDMHIELYKILKETCDERDVTVTKYITRAVANRLKIEAEDKMKQIKG